MPGYMGMTGGGPQLHPKMKRRPLRHPRKPKPPKKGYCPHCGQDVTPAPGSPMHQGQQMPEAIAANLPPGMGAGGPPDMGPGGPGAGPPPMGV